MANSLLDGNGLSSEFFYIAMKEVDPKTGKIWDDRGTNANRSVAFWKVDPSPGYYALGHFATDFHNIEPDQGRNAPVAITLKPKPGYEYLLAEPTGFDKMWDDADSGGTYGGCYIWRMKCPDGYVALGDIVTSGEPPSAGSVRCIKQNVVKEMGETVSLVTNAGYMNFANDGETDLKAFWDDKGSGANKDAAIWLMKATGRPFERNQVYLVAGTFKASKYHNIFPSAEAYALLLSFPENDIMEKAEMQNKKIRLTSARLPTKEEMRASEVTNEYFVPFFAVQDDRYKNQLQQFKVSPTYKIVRTTRYEAIDSYEPINTETKEFSVTVGKSTETNYNNEVGITLGVSVEIGGEAGIAVGKTSMKVTASVEASYSHSWGGSTSEYEEKSFMYPQTVTGGCFGVLFQAKNTYTIYRQDGTVIGSPVAVNINEFYTDEWRPEGILPESASTDSPAKTTSPNTIIFTIEAPPGKTIILEGRLEIRDGQLISAPTVISVPITSAVPVGQAMLFDSTTPQMIVNNKLSRSYTKEAWIRMSNPTDQGYNIISGGPSGEHAFWVNVRKVGAGHNSKWDYVQCKEPVSQDWEHYAVTYDADTQEMNLYKNGKMVSSSKQVPNYQGGNFVQVGGYDKGYKFMGEMAEVRIWNNARTEEQIAAQMNVSIPKATAGLIAKYPVA